MFCIYVTAYILNCSGFAINIIICTSAKAFIVNSSGFAMHLYYFSLLLTVAGEGWLSGWEDWTKCTVSCGNGTIRRYRGCNRPPYGSTWAGFCSNDGTTEEIKDCIMEFCPGNILLKCFYCTYPI